jgi:hypothetical protein
MVVVSLAALDPPTWKRLAKMMTPAYKYTLVSGTQTGTYENPDIAHAVV